MLCECHEAEAGEHVLLALRQELLDDALLEERSRQAQAASVEVAGKRGQKVSDGGESSLKLGLLDGVGEVGDVGEQQDEGGQQVRAAE